METLKQEDIELSLRHVDTSVWGKLCSSFSVFCLALASADISAANNSTCNLLQVEIFPESYFEHELVCYPYSEVVCQLFSVENEVFSNTSVTFLSELGLLRLCFARKCIPFFHTIKPMTLSLGHKIKGFTPYILQPQKKQ